MNYVISDIHGHLELFKKMLGKINFQSEDKLYILGDMVDRGSEPIKVVQYIMKQSNMYVIQGNHENLMLDVLEDENNEKALERWYRNGGEMTHNQYKALEVEEQHTIKAYLEQRPLYLALEKYLLVHAGISAKPHETWEEVRDRQTKRDLIWMRDEFIDYPTITDKKVIFGHTQTFKMGEVGSIWFGSDKIGIDCGVYCGEKGGRLGCLNLDTLETYYVI